MIKKVDQYNAQKRFSVVIFITFGIIILFFLDGKFRSTGVPVLSVGLVLYILLSFRHKIGTENKSKKNESSQNHDFLQESLQKTNRLSPEIDLSVIGNEYRQSEHYQFEQIIDTIKARNLINSPQNYYSFFPNSLAICSAPPFLCA